MLRGAGALARLTAGVRGRLEEAAHAAALPGSLVPGRQAEPASPLESCIGTLLANRQGPPSVARPCPDFFKLDLGDLGGNVVLLWGRRSGKARAHGPHAEHTSGKRAWRALVRRLSEEQAIDKIVLVGDYLDLTDLSDRKKVSDLSELWKEDRVAPSGSTAFKALFERSGLHTTKVYLEEAGCASGGTWEGFKPLFDADFCKSGGQKVRLDRPLHRVKLRSNFTGAALTEFASRPLRAHVGKCSTCLLPKGFLPDSTEGIFTGQRRLVANARQRGFLANADEAPTEAPDALGFLREALGDGDPDVDPSDLVRLTKAIIRSFGWWSAEEDEGNKGWLKKDEPPQKRGTHLLCGAGDELLTKYAEALLEKLFRFQPDVGDDVNAIAEAVATLARALSSNKK